MAKVTKILETTLIAGATSVTFNDADIPNSLIRIYCTNSNLYPLNISLTGTSLTVSYEIQNSDMGVALELVKQGLDINDTLTSTADNEALSAKQGKILKDTIDGLVIPDEITDLSDVEVTDIEDGQVLAWDDELQKFVNVDQSGGESYIPNYTTTEKVVGTWLNETLYGMIIEPNYQISGTSWQDLPTTITNGKDLINMRCWDYSTEYFLFDVEIRRINSATGKITIKPSSNVNSRTIKRAYIEYTKGV